MPEFSPDLIVRLAVSFLLGSIPFAVLSMIGSKVDIRTIGSGNPGFNNVLRVSKPRAILCLIGDLGKGVLAILLLYRPSEPMSVAWLLGFAVMLGHCYSPFLKFNGGKGIATSAGVMLVLYPLLALGCVAAYVLLRLVGHKMKWPEGGALASLLCWALFAVMLFFLEGLEMAMLAAVMFAIVTWRHKANLQRLTAGMQAP
jgi:glycerol-3-phosphate acyltransferase PlsY